MRHSRRPVMLAASVFSACAVMAAAPEYVTYDVHPAGADASQIFGMNTVGEGVGSVTRSGVTRAAYWSDPGAPPVELDGFGDTLTRAFDVNSAGEIVGLGTTAGAIRAIYWRRFDAAPVQLGDMGHGARANAINDRGEIVGNVAGAAANTLFPAYWPRADTAPVLLATFGDTGQTADINNRGRIIGTLRDASQQSQPIVWIDSSAAPRILPGVNASSSPTGLNDRGHIVGRNPTGPGVFQPVFWQWSPADGDYQPAVGLGSLATDGRGEPVEISDVGEIVGWSGAATAAQATVWRVRTVYSRGEPAVMTEPPAALAGLGGAFARPQTINNAGAIGGESAAASGPVHATLWLTH